MQAQVEIEFDQLVKLAKQLPATQWKKLKMEVENGTKKVALSPSLENLLLAAPTFNKKQLKQITQTRKAITKWRTK